MRSEKIYGVNKQVLEVRREVTAPRGISSDRTGSAGFSHRRGSPMQAAVRAIACASLLLSVALPGGSRASDFEDAVRSRVALYEAARKDPAAAESALAGHFEEVHDSLEAVVPDAEKTAVDHFVLGNMLYEVDPERSFAHHRAALARLPDEPAVWLEMAYQHHRRGDCDAALPFYERSAAAGRLDPPQHALLAHCLVRVGRYRDALHAWAATGYASRHTAVDFTIHDVFGELSPLARHDRLMKRVRSGERAAVGELFENALAWRRDWWNAGSNREAVAAARAAVEQRFGADSLLAREIRVWEAARETGTAEELRALLEEEGLILGTGRLPESSFVARALLTAVARRGLVSVADLADRFSKEVEQRARGPEPDPDALVLLSAFTAETGDAEALREVDRYGWKRYRNADFALSLIFARRDALADGFRHDDPLLQEALADFPKDPRFALIAVARARAAGADTPAHVARLIDAEYHGLRSDDSRYSRALQGYYRELARRLPEGDLPARAGD